MEYEYGRSGDILLPGFDSRDYYSYLDLTWFCMCMCVCLCVSVCVFSLALRGLSCHVYGHSSSPWRGLHGKDWWSLANHQQRMKAYQQQLEEMYKLILQPQISLETAEVFAYTLNIPLWEALSQNHSTKLFLNFWLRICEIMLLLLLLSRFSRVRLCATP